MQLFEVSMCKKFLFVLLTLWVGQAFGAVYYVAVDGNDSNMGSKDKPFATLKKANVVVNAGDTVWIRGGVYEMHDTTYCERARMSAGVLLTTSGESDDKRIHYFAYPGERPIFDGTKLLIGQALDKTNSSTDLEYTAGILIYASYLHLKGIEVRNVPMKYNSNSGVYVTRCRHVILEQMESHHNAGPGFFVNEGGTEPAAVIIFSTATPTTTTTPTGARATVKMPTVLAYIIKNPVLVTPPSSMDAVLGGIAMTASTLLIRNSPWLWRTVMPWEMVTAITGPKSRQVAMATALRWGKARRARGTISSSIALPGKIGLQVFMQITPVPEANGLTILPTKMKTVPLIWPLRHTTPKVEKLPTSPL